MNRLPGGLWYQGNRYRDFAFRPVDGALELMIAEATTNAASTAAAVTQTLSHALAHLGGQPAGVERIRALTVGDRQYLMRCLCVHLGQHEQWLSADCHQCGAPFDFHLRLDELPVREGSDHGDRVTVRLEGNAWYFRLPNGGDQETLANENDPRKLLERCVLPDSHGAVSTLPHTALETIDSALEAAAAQVVTEVQARCPECDAGTAIALNPYELLGRPAEQLLREVHQMAIHYHWSERDILALPHQRRGAYLKLIDQARGLSQ